MQVNDCCVAQLNIELSQKHVLKFILSCFVASQLLLERILVIV
jgi:hypothetical protein